MIKYEQGAVATKPDQRDEYEKRFDEAVTVFKRHVFEPPKLKTFLAGCDTRKANLTVP
jgi:hypothetical protein